MQTSKFTPYRHRALIPFGKNGILHLTGFFMNYFETSYLKPYNYVHINEH